MNQQCGNCKHHVVIEMNQGEITEVRCYHPIIETIHQNESYPDCDWLIDKNSFRPQDGQTCRAWESEIDENLSRRIYNLEMKIRNTCGPELNCLSNMGIGFIEKAVEYYQGKAKA